MAVRKGRRFQTVVLIDPDIHEKVQLWANERFTSQAEVLRDIVRLGVPRYEQQRELLRQQDETQKAA
mgnify:CR=1 FL=1